ncbi:hypothetical protein GOBAR_DD29600 [Gossypium barbadense]|nr:hypothetical protein GOBAR_DD29600 [Gossypium barbadense]
MEMYNQQVEKKNMEGRRGFARRKLTEAHGNGMHVSKEYSILQPSKRPSTTAMKLPYTVGGVSIKLTPSGYYKSWKFEPFFFL